MLKAAQEHEHEAPVPEDLATALSANPTVQSAWANLTAIGRRDFIGWINEAELADTRQRRIERCCENLLKGKRRPCCYAVVPMDLYKTFGTLPEVKAAWSFLSASEKRDFTEWVEDSPDKATRKERITQTCIAVAAGERTPRYH